MRADLICPHTRSGTGLEAVPSLGVRNLSRHGLEAFCFQAPRGCLIVRGLLRTIPTAALVSFCNHALSPSRCGLEICAASGSRAAQARPIEMSFLGPAKGVVD